MRIGHALAALAAGLVIATTAAPAAAQREPAQSAAAKAEFKAAQKQFNKGDYAGALLKFKQILEETGSPNARLYVARSLRELGRLEEAYEELTATMNDAAAHVDSEPKYAATRTAAATERTELEAKIVRLVIDVPKKPAGLEVELDGKRLAEDRLGATLVFAPGTVKITARAPGRVSFEETRAIAAGESDTVTISLPVAATRPPPSKAEPDPFKDDHAPRKAQLVREGGGVRTLGIVVLGVGIAGGATFAIAGLMANSRYDELHGECGATGCNDASHKDRIDSGRTLDLVANIGLVAGGVGIAAGTLMILVGGPTERQVTGLGVEGSPQGAALRYRASF